MPDRLRDSSIDKLGMALARILVLSGLVPLMLRAASDEEVNISLNVACRSAAHRIIHHASCPKTVPIGVEKP